MPLTIEDIGIPDKEQTSFDESAFQTWYKRWAQTTGIDPNPDDPRHFYDYRAAYRAEAKPEISPDDGKYHWPSQFKSLHHPNRFVGGIDTITGKRVLSDEESKRADNSLFYARQLGIDPQTAYDLEPELNVQAFGTEVITAEPGKMFFDAFKQSLADKPAMMLKGTEVYTPGRAMGMDSLLDKASTYLRSLQDPEERERLQKVASGRLWPTGEDRRWWQVEARYLPEVINAWAANVGDQIPIMLITQAGRTAGRIIGAPIAIAAGGAAALVTGGPDPSDVVTAPAVVAIVSEVTKHLGGAVPMIAMEAGNFMDAAEALKLDRDISEKYAKSYGLGSGAIEYAQQLWLLGRYSRISKAAQTTILKQVLSHIGG
ncbi:hypothetical protein LCGC14_2845370, partial [marine sediment metagenome]